MRKIILSALLFALPTVAGADEIADAVKARQDHMKAYESAVVALVKMAKGETKYDPAMAEAAANEIAKLANTDISVYFVPGSSSEDLPGKSRAKPALWTDGAKVGEVAMKLSAAAEELQLVAGSGQQQMAAGLGGVAGACKACHDLYRAPEE